MPVLVTERLVLRPWSAEDLEALAAIFSVPEVWRFPMGRGLNREETARFLDRALAAQAAGTPFPWAAEERAGGGLIGYVGLAVPEFLPEIMPAVEVGWRLVPDRWGRGLATEGGRASLAHGFGVLGLEEVVSIYQPENVASGRVMARLGMRVERDTMEPKSGVALRVLRLRRDEWEEIEAAKDAASAG
jgi:RimJ/RimL family protein N-acetyltransferase